MLATEVVVASCYLFRKTRACIRLHSGADVYHSGAQSGSDVEAKAYSSSRSGGGTAGTLRQIHRSLWLGRDRN